MLRALMAFPHERRKACVGPLSLLALCLGTLWLSLLGSICITTGELKPRGTYVSENALMPSSALTEVNGVDLEQKRFPESGFEDLGFPAMKGAMFRSHSASDRRECLALVAQEGRGDDILIALAHALQRSTWLSKDVLFLIVPRNETSPRSPTLRRWLETYINGPTYDRLARGGPIRGAVVIDVPPSAGRRGEPALVREAILVQGMDGRLPNMDMLNLAHMTAPAFAVSGKGQSFFEDEADDTTSKTLQGVRFARDVLLGPTGWHGEFLHFGVESLSLKATAAPAQRNSGTTRLEFAQRVEKMVRSLSNIGEKFNRSFFFYVMLGLDNFVSIDEFLWALFMFISPLYVDAFFVALAPNESGFKQTRRALASLGLAVLSGLAVLISIKRVPLPPLATIVLSLVAFALWERFASQRRNRKQRYQATGEESLPSWHYKKAANEVYVFICLSALGVVHFPLALYAAALCYPAARLALARPSGRHAGQWLAFIVVHALVVGTLVTLAAFDEKIPLRVSYETADMRSAVLYLVVLPANMMTLSVLWGANNAPVVVAAKQDSTANTKKTN